MQQIPLSKVPSQDLSINLDGVYWRLSFHLSMDFVCADISRDGTNLISGVRCFVDQPLLPYPYMYEPSFGNFIFDSDVDWENFDGTCSLYYLNSAEFSDYNRIKEEAYAASAILGLRTRDQKFAASKIKVPDGFPSITPTITIHPASHTVSIGDPVTFNIEATNADEFIWQFAVTKSSAWQQLQDGVSKQYQIASCQTWNKGFYRCVAVGDGNAKTSIIAELEVV